jgi:hypothetical protein
LWLILPGNYWETIILRQVREGNDWKLQPWNTRQSSSSNSLPPPRF